MSEDRAPEAPPAADDRRPPPDYPANGAGPAEADDVLDAPSPPPSWREDWRAALANGDESRAKQLARFSTPEAVAKAFFDTRAKLTSANQDGPPEAATDQELAAWRKQVGVPETPDGYGISFPDNIKASDAAKEELGTFLKHMHDNHVPPRAVKAAFESYVNLQAARAEREAEISEEATRDNLILARQDFPGREWTRMFGTRKNPGGLANEFLNSHFDGPEAQEALTELLDMKLSSGVRVADSVHWIRAIAAMARATATEDDLISSDLGGGGQSVDDEFKTLAAKPRLTEAERDRMTQLAEARLKRQERMAAR